jgi:hypothetical protein
VGTCVDSIRHIVQKAEQAVEDEERCHYRWSQLFILYGFCSFFGGLAFVLNGKGYSNSTADIERTAAELGSSTASDSKMGTTGSTDEHNEQANGHTNGTAGSTPVRAPPTAARS